MKNDQLNQLIHELKKTSSVEGVKLWRAVAKELEKPTRSRRVVNLTKLDKYAKENETVLVPGKVLGSGDVNKKMTVIAYKFSDQAATKISGKGAVMSIEECLKQNPKGKNIKIMG